MCTGQEKVGGEYFIRLAIHHIKVLPGPHFPSFCQTKASIQAKKLFKFHLPFSNKVLRHKKLASASLCARGTSFSLAWFFHPYALFLSPFLIRFPLLFCPSFSLSFFSLFFFPPSP
ncbi:hypothetical protein BCR43DRAFT_359002 [Syncephalastrum racemosum]|uniref:Transmembrane protein n=1 Tax=Syncephalastrum racemosum TaxID=13706 RepID=A0A1X2H6U7_SYNRA|nr:hypothetical protein BCR43DRAFT_359002 [Syncephalastrum racemosum]